MAKQLTATTEYGTFTRTTDRVYTHVVLGFGLFEDDIRRGFANHLKSQIKTVDDCRKVLESGIVPPAFSGLTIADYKRILEDAEKKIATHDERLAERVAKNAQDIAEKRNPEITWTGRPDLAIKAAGKLRKYRPVVAVFEVDK